jgi:hypothetical protein
MSTINSFTGLVSSLLLNVGLTGLAEKLDPMQRDVGAVRNVLNFRSAAFCETPCNFRSSAFCETPCNFRPSAFCETPCNFVPQGA